MDNSPLISVSSTPLREAMARRLHHRSVVTGQEYEYEKVHLPDGAWPPASWYADWVSGVDAFELERTDCPIEMRWLVYEKTN
jgi:hypothetical protein